MSPGVVTQPDTEVLDGQRLLLPDLLHGDDLSGGLLELPQLSQEVPEPKDHNDTSRTKDCTLPRLGDDLVRGEDPHPVQRSDGLRLGGQLPPDHPVLLQSSLGLHGVCKIILVVLKVTDRNAGEIVSTSVSRMSAWSVTGHVVAAGEPLRHLCRTARVSLHCRGQGVGVGWHAGAVQAELVVGTTALGLYQF